ncbi:MAG: deoxyribose-phosphate aldolase [Anaerolineaceae bacterium]|jgi:deoxyribose-phosphate aldolase|nr:deoxyribose-phosphate aldolase [Anaerolineaceae bacterium]
MTSEESVKLHIPANFASTLDVSLLKPTVTPTEIKALCEAGQREGFHICINSCYTPLVRQLVGPDFQYQVAACVSFPFGTACTHAKVDEARWAVEQGATEIDMVMAVGLLKEGPQYYGAVEEDIAAVVAAARAAGASATKVIIETCYLTDAEKETACKLVTHAGAGFVKTSTGYGTGGATVEDIRLMRRVAGPEVRVKAAGGIRTLAQCLALLEAGADRLGIGMAGSLAILDEARKAQA